MGTRFAEFDDDETTLPERYVPMRPKADHLEATLRDPVLTIIEIPINRSEFEGNPTIKICIQCLHEAEGCVCVK